jgi:hypothetical protein
MAESQDTHPVYISVDRKNAVKAIAVDRDESIKTITERFCEHGESLGLEDVPVGDEPTNAVIEHLFDAGIAEEAEDGTINIPLEAEPFK